MNSQTSPQMAVSQAAEVVLPVHPRCKIFSISLLRKAHTAMLARGDVVEADILADAFTGLFLRTDLEPHLAVKQ